MTGRKGAGARSCVSQFDLVDANGRRNKTFEQAVVFAFLNSYGANSIDLVRPIGFQDCHALGKVLLIDPWLTNPVNKNGKEEVAR